MVMASLLHDIGHLLGLETGLQMGMNSCGILDHEKVGASFLKSLGFSERICKLVESHVNAKRYLCCKDLEYLNKLSDASKTTLSFQNGKMTDNEAVLFESDVDYKNYLLMRTFDEAAEVKDMDVPPLASYFTITNTVLSEYVLSDIQIDFFHKNGFLKITNLLSYYGITSSQVGDWTNEISTWPKETNKWLSHYEEGANGEKLLCRHENFLDYHPSMNHLSKECVLKVVSQLFHEPAVLFKEKINYKLPGGAGFAAHQDSPAYK
jgi:predicted HD phosphohydrolase